MFNFFRPKDKPGDFMSFIKKGMPDAASGPGARMGREASKEEHIGIEVMEAGGDLPPELEEAAVLFASGKVGEAATLLNRYLLDHPESKDPQPWYMLFDLYEVSGQLEHFEDTAVDFAVKFERSPPTWAPRAQLQNRGKEGQTLMSFGAAFGPADRARLQRFLEEAALRNTVRVDVTRCPVPDEAYARAILQCLVTLQEQDIAVHLLGVAALIERLDAARRQQDLAEPVWLLLLELLQLEGREIQFEDAAVDYAIRFEVSPPSFSPPTPATGDPQTFPGRTPSGLDFPMHGIVGMAGDRQFAELRKFAEDKPCLEIDLSAVTRIDFGAIGVLLDTLIWMHNAGRKVLFKEGNELVNVLLEVVGAAQFAAVLGRTRA